MGLGKKCRTKKHRVIFSSLFNLFIARNRDHIAKLKQIKEIKVDHTKQKMKEKPSIKSFCRDMDRVFEPSKNQQKKTEAMGTGIEVLGRAILKILEKFDPLSRRDTEFLTKLIKSNRKISSVPTIFANLMIKRYY